MNTRYDRKYLDAADLLTELINEYKFMSILNDKGLEVKAILDVVETIEEFDEWLNDSVELD